MPRRGADRGSGKLRGEWVVIGIGRVVLNTVKIVIVVIPAARLASARVSSGILHQFRCRHRLRSVVVVVSVRTGCRGGGGPRLWETAGEAGL